MKFQVSLRFFAGALITGMLATPMVQAQNASTDCTGGPGGQPCCHATGDYSYQTVTAWSTVPNPIVGCTGTVVQVTNNYSYKVIEEYSPQSGTCTNKVVDTKSGPRVENVTITNGMTQAKFPVDLGHGLAITNTTPVTAKNHKTHYMKFLKNILASNATDSVVGSWISEGNSRLQTDDDGAGSDDVSVCAQLVQSGSINTHSDTNLAYIVNSNIGTANDALVANGKNVYISKTVIIDGLFSHGCHYNGNIFINHAPAPSTLVHELGHICGLEHPDAPNNNHIMWDEAPGFGLPDPGRRVKSSVAYKYE